MIATANFKTVEITSLLVNNKPSFIISFFDGTYVEPFQLVNKPKAKETQRRLTAKAVARLANEFLGERVVGNTTYCVYSLV